MSEEHFVIIGNGPAANEAALTLRERDSKARITIVGQELKGQYKPHLLPDFIAGAIEEDDLYLTGPAFFKERNIKLRLGQKVVGADFRGGWIILEHKEIIPFSGLIIATGARPRIPETVQIFEDLMLTLKTPADAKVWIDRLSEVDSVVLVGGDLVSLSVTDALVSLGKRVNFVIDEESFWPVPFSYEIREQVARRLVARGVRVLSGCRLMRVRRLSATSLEVVTDCETLHAGILGAFFGLIPNVKFLSRTGLDIERGILVDEHLKTRFDHVYAAGDCAQVYHPAIRNYWVSIGYENARLLGRIAALNLLGGKFTVEVARESIFRMDSIRVNTSWWMEL